MFNDMEMINLSQASRIEWQLNKNNLFRLSWRKKFNEL